MKRLINRNLGRFLARVSSILIIPIAIPAWVIERVLQSSKPNWQFNSVSATPYFVLLTLLSTITLFYCGTLLTVISVYVMTAMELLSIWMCVAIAIGHPSNVVKWLNEFGKRDQNKISAQQVLLTPMSFFRATVSYFFTIYYFAFIYYLVYRFSPDSFSGIKDTNILERFLAFVYFSVVAISTLGFGDIVPQTPIARILIILEVFTGLFFIVFLFGAFVSYQVGKLK